MRLSLSLFAGAALATAALGAPAQASVCVGCSYLTSYDVTTALYDVTDIAIMERWEGGSSVTNSFDVYAGGTLITNPFPKTYSVTNAFLLGVASNLEGDSEGQKHLVIFASDSWAASAKGIAFGTIFTSTFEASIIEALENIGGASTDESVIWESVDRLFRFSDNDAFGNTIGDLTFTPGQSFTLIAFSDGQVIGDGTSAVATIAAPIPEPASWALMIGGFGLLGANLRRARRTTRIRFT